MIYSYHIGVNMLKIRHCKYLLLLLLLGTVGTMEGMAKDAFTLRAHNDGYIQYNSIHGEGKSQSMLQEGWGYYDQFNIYSRGKVDDYKYYFNLGLKATNDRTKDVKDLSLTTIKGSLSNKNHALKAGDVYQSFSQYALNAPVKGISYDYKNDTGSEKVQLVVGESLPRWDSFWSDQTKTTKRLVYGGKYTHNFSPTLSTGVSFVGTDDDKSDSVFASMPLYRNYLGTLDLVYRPLRGLIITGEYSYSDNTRKKTDTFVEEKESGSAYKIRAVADQDPSRVELEYEYVDPGYITLSGSATPDRQKAKATWRYKQSRDLYTHVGMLWFRDNLENQKSGTTHTYRPSIGVTLNHLWSRSRATADLTYKYDYIKRPLQESKNHFIDLNYQDMFGSIGSITNLGYHIYNVSGDTVKNNEVVFNTALNGRYYWSAVVMKPTLYFGTWNQDDELQNNDSTFFQAAIGFGLDVPKQKITSSLRVGKNKTDRKNFDNNEKFFATLNLYWRAGDLSVFKRSLLYLRAFHNDFSYTQVSRDFQEDSIVLGLKNQF